MDNFEEGISVKVKFFFYYLLNKIISIGIMIKEVGYEVGIEYLNFDE